MFFIQNEEVNNVLSEIATPAILQHPETIRSFYNEEFFKQHQFIIP
jgi:hypothetical protein